MQTIFSVFIRIKHILLFIVLFIIGCILTIEYRYYHKTIWFEFTGDIIGRFYEVSDEFTSFIDLKKQNKLLIKENTRILNSLSGKNQLYQVPLYLNDSIITNQYEFIPTRVIKGSYNLESNYFLLNKGALNGIRKNMGVITSRGIIGVIVAVSNHYSKVLPILNKKSRIIVRLKKSMQSGIMTWNTKDYRTIQIIDLTLEGHKILGDTVISHEYSAIFPPSIPIGVVNNISLSKENGYYIANIELFEDFSSLEHVFIVRQKNFDQINQIFNQNK